MAECAKLPLENNPLHIWGLHILWHRVESKHQNGNRCEASRLRRTAACMLCVFTHHSLSLASLSSALAKHNAWERVEGVGKIGINHGGQSGKLDCEILQSDPTHQP